MMEDPGKQRLREGLKDAALFGRVVSAGLVVAGYVFAGVYLARWLERWVEAREYPDWPASLVPAAAALFGLWQGWLFLTRLAGRERKDGEKKAPRR